MMYILKPYSKRGPYITSLERVYVQLPKPPGTGEGPYSRPNGAAHPGTSVAAEVLGVRGLGYTVYPDSSKSP